MKTCILNNICRGCRRQPLQMLLSIQYIRTVSFEKIGKGGKTILTKNMGGGGGAKGVHAIAHLLGGYGGILNLYPNRCNFRLICSSQMT